MATDGTRHLSALVEIHGGGDGVPSALGSFHDGSGVCRVRDGVCDGAKGVPAAVSQASIRERRI